MPEDLRAHVVHGLLADALHDADLNVLGEKIEEQNAEIKCADQQDAVPGQRIGHAAGGAGNQIIVDRALEESRRRQFERRDDGDERKGQEDTHAIRAHVLQQPPHQPRVVSLA